VQRDSTHKDASVVRYSVLHENEQLFASKYKLVLPSEEELRAELDRNAPCLRIKRDWLVLNSRCLMPRAAAVTVPNVKIGFFRTFGELQTKSFRNTPASQ
jgi:hypothetical protein